MYLLGIDIGTSSIKVSVVEIATKQCIVSSQYPESESAITSLQTGWAEQSPEMWWEHVQKAILKAHSSQKYNSLSITAIGISYQMHGLVVVDKNKQVLRDSIIWCDSRAVTMGEKAFNTIGSEKCLSHLLNSPGNFTASKLAWVKENEPAIFEKIATVMLPGDYISMKFTNHITTSIAALSEGIFWDFKNKELSKEVLQFYGFDSSIIAPIQNVFSNHGELEPAIARALFLKPGIPVTYKAGDQPNNALSLNVLEPGEVAATAGTSGVIYGVTDQVTYDPLSRVNTFAHVNHTQELNRLGVLLCINGTGILNSWVKKITATNLNYDEMNLAAAKVKVGCDGLMIMPFGNGAERIFNNKIIGAHLNGIDLNKHGAAHIYRAAQEGIAYAFRYGLDIMRENGMKPSVIRAGKSNMFLSETFTSAFVNATQVPVELYHSDGSIGAALGAGIGSKVFTSAKEAFDHFTPIKLVEPTQQELYDELYMNWKNTLQKYL